MPPPTRSNNYGPNMHAPPPFQQPMAAHVNHGLLDRDRYTHASAASAAAQHHQQQVYAAQAQLQAAQAHAQAQAQAQAQAAAARQHHAQHVGSHQQQQQAQQQAQQAAQQQAQQQQQKEIMGILHGGGPRGRLGGAGAGAANAAVQAQVQAAAGVNNLTGVGAGVGVVNGNNDGGGVIRDVWAEDLEREIAVLRDVVERYPYVAMDTEFPGIVARPIGKFPTKADYHYQTLRCNVDMLKVIQLGITLADENGDLAKVDGLVSTWQFNFRFSLEDDMYAQESIDLLKSSGIDFAKHTHHGIDPHKFGELLITSGLVMLPEVKWVSFHSGYDFGYLVKIMSCTPLPKEEAEFRKRLAVFFPSLYDIKFLMKSCHKLKGGLQEIAEELGIQRIGPQHQAGSDSLLTGLIFFQMRARFFDGRIEDDKYLGQVWGLNGNVPSVPTTNGTSQNPSTPPPPSETPNQNNINTQTPPPSQLAQRNGTPGTPGVHSGYTSGFGKMGM